MVGEVAEGGGGGGKVSPIEGTTTVLGGTGGEEMEEKREKADAEMMNWVKLVALVTVDFGEGRLAEEAMWQAVVLIPKGKGEYRGIGLMKVMWKVMEDILNFRVTASINYHEFLHRFWIDHGTGTATLEAKLLHQLAALREEVLYMIFLETHKAYDGLDRSICLGTLEGYYVGPQACRLLSTYWGRLRMVAKAGEYYGLASRGSRGWRRGTHFTPPSSTW